MNGLCHLIEALLEGEIINYKVTLYTRNMLYHLIEALLEGEVDGAEQPGHIYILKQNTM